mgnify:CR=1 FL=1
MKGVAVMRKSMTVITAFAGFVLILICGVVSAETKQLLVRAENIIVPPSTGPVTNIIISNPGDTLCQRTLRFNYPDGWKISPQNIEISLKPQETKKIPISINKAVDLESTKYPVEITVDDGSESAIIKQTIFSSTTPVFTPKIDGNLKDWKPAVPITFETKDKKATIRTGWNKRHFYFAAEVEEDELVSYKKGSDKPFDAVQFAIAPRKTETPASADQKSQRYEFVIVDESGFFASDKCFQLMAPGDDISVSQKTRQLSGLEFKSAKIAVKRHKNITTYECSIPFSKMRKLRPMVGRDYQFSVLIHDPDGTGIRDLGRAAGLWESQRSKYAWSSWQGVKWGKKAQFDSKIEWAFSTSKY